MDMSKHKLEMIMKLCGDIIEDMSIEDEGVEEGMEEDLEVGSKPVAAIEITKIGKPVPEDMLEEEDEEEEEMPRRFGRVRMS